MKRIALSDRHGLIECTFEGSEFIGGVLFIICVSETDGRFLLNPAHIVTIYEKG